MSAFIYAERFARGVLFMIINWAVFVPYYIVVVLLALPLILVFRGKAKRPILSLITVPARFYRYFGTEGTRKKAENFIQRMGEVAKRA